MSILVLGIYFTRLGAAPICGEESRWANVAREMIASGDWIVPHQQGALFAERPPLCSWVIGLVGLARGQVDLVAVRLPSACAMLIMTWLIYYYAQTWMSRGGSLAAAAIFATFGQVMILGRLGESEALFSLFTAGSLLVWHLGYIRRWPMGLVWSLGYSLAALGSLAKGLQAPVYFVGTCGTFLVLRRDWPWLLSLAHGFGIICFAAIVGVWLVPFSRDCWHALDDIWAGLAQDRFTLRGLLSHLASYPLETLGCLLPWSPLLVPLVKSSVRRSLGRRRPQIQFLVVALAVTYPTVWLAAGARGRYYMPLYPCLAVLMGLVVEHCTAWCARRADFALWRRYLWGLAAATCVGGAALVIVNTVPIAALENARQTLPFLAVWSLAATTATAVLIWASRAKAAPRPQVAVLTIAAFIGLASTGVALNARIRAGNELAEVIAEVKQQVADPAKLVSFGKIYHRFAYSYGTPIRQVPWPVAAQDLPPNVTYFCFDRRPADTADDRAGDDDRLGAHTPGTLPFAWEKVAEIPCDPVKRAESHRWVVVGRVRHGEFVASPAINPTARR